MPCIIHYAPTNSANYGAERAIQVCAWRKKWGRGGGGGGGVDMITYRKKDKLEYIRMREDVERKKVR